MDARHDDAWGNDQFSYMQAESRTVTKSTTAPCAGQQNAADAYLEPLIEELVARHTNKQTNKKIRISLFISLKAEELGYSKKRLS
jgi:hypothetical protein